MSQPVVETASRVGEVVESATDRCTVQCYRLYQAPPLGTLVMTKSPAVYGVVSRISTESLYPGRPVVPAVKTRRRKRASTGPTRN